MHGDVDDACFPAEGATLKRPEKAPLEREGELLGASAAVPDTGPLLPPSGRLLPFAWARLLWGRRRLDEARIASLVVDPDAADLPVGAVLLAETARRALSMGIHTLHLSGALAEDPALPALAREVGAPLSLHHRVYAGSTGPPLFSPWPASR